MIASECELLFSRGCKSLMHGVVAEELAGDKVVWGDPCTEGSHQTAKKSVLTNRYYKNSTSCKAYMRHDCPGKQAHLCKAPRTPKGQTCRYDRNRQRKMRLPGEVSD